MCHGRTTLCTDPGLSPRRQAASRGTLHPVYNYRHNCPRALARWILQHVEQKRGVGGWGSTDPEGAAVLILLPLVG